MKVWITKYALSTGIYTATDVTVCSNISDRMISYTSSHGYRVHMHKPDWHESYHDAVARAEIMRVRAILSKKRAIEKLESLVF